MTAKGWIATGRRTLAASFLGRRRTRRAATRGLRPGLESLESIDLMSGFRHPVAVAPGEVLAFRSSAVTSMIASQAVSSTATSTPVQTAVAPSTLTNFGTPQPLPTLPAGSLPPGTTISPSTPGQGGPAVPFVPPLNLFNPSLGQLVGVHVSVTARLTSDIRSQNTSTSSGANITGYTLGSFSIDGLDQSVKLSGFSTTPSVAVTPYPQNGPPPNFQNDGTTAFFPNVNFSRSQTLDFTQPSDLAFFTASAGRSAISPTLSATAQAGAAAPNGNLQTAVATQAGGTVTITYTYVCPTVTQVVRYGIHHQPTQLRVTFSGPLNPPDASNTANYTIIVPNRFGSFTGAGATTIPVASAAYEPATNSVLLTTAKRLNVHHLFQIRLSLPCFTTPAVIEFGGKKSLGGFHDHQGHFVPVVGGKVVR